MPILIPFDFLGTGGVGLRATNENPSNLSGATGGEYWDGLIYNDDTNVLTIEARWGSAFGFTDLTGPGIAAHIHEVTASPLTSNGAVIFDLGSSFGASAGGFSNVRVTLSEAQETSLFAGFLYINVHTAMNPGGEIRANMVSAFTTGDNVVVLGPAEGTWNALAGNDSVTGTVGQDTIIGGAGADTLAGGDGDDMLSYVTSAGGVYVDLSTNFATDGDATGDVISGFEKVVGSGASDVLIGSAIANVMTGGSGADYVYAGDGTDTVFGDVDNDVLFGQGGSDTVYGGAGVDYIYGGTGTNTLYGEAGVDIIVIEGTNDSVFGGGSTNNSGGTGDVDYFYILDGAINPKTYGDNGIDIYIDLSGGTTGRGSMEGLGGQDYYFGGVGNTSDTFYGGADGDVFSGGGGDDRFDGGTGYDYGTGGAGNDLYDVSASNGVLIINDFVGGGTEDHVRLFGTQFSSFTQVQAALTATAAGMILTVDDDTSIWFLGLNTTSLTASDFSFWF